MCKCVSGCVYGGDDGDGGVYIFAVFFHLTWEY